MSAKTVTLAGQVYDLPDQFTLRQLRGISKITMREIPRTLEDLETFKIDQAVDIIVVALDRSPTPLTSEQILDSTSDFKELATARMVVMDLGGFTVKGDKKPGEDSAGA